jgi:16S rRNA (cytidine1402-2'-O)-methyltransferase
MLYLVATPIGNLGDMSLRAIETLRKADYIASEDTRKTGILLKHFTISAKNPQIPFHEHNERRAGQRIMALLKAGKSIALVTNAGTPGISDPGFTLVRSAIEAGVELTMAPGPCALVMAVVLSGLAVHGFVFRGYPPRTTVKRRKFFAEDKELPHTLIYYESPYRLREFIEDAIAVFGDRRAAIAKELTKMFESVKRGRLSELLAGVDDKPKGEYVVVIEGKKETSTMRICPDRVQQRA